MNHRLINKLAISNIKTNSKTVIPYLIAGGLTVLIFYILYSLAFCPYIYKDGVEAFYGAKTITIFMEIGMEIVGVFAAIFLLYANNFVMKSRKREVGLYGILGLSKKNIAALLGLETILYAAISIGSGVLVGTVLNKLMLLALYKVIGLASINGFFISIKALAGTILFFAIIYGVILVYNVATISLGNPIDLLKSNKTGEKEPKVKWLLVIIGVVSIAIGYYLALNCHTTMKAIATFFEAVILVIIGTFCLFTAGSIFLLKILKKNKKYYYKTRHFISVSNLIYRMKHNAAGLAAICILSTGFILLMTCASTLMALGEQNINMLYPNDIKLITCDDNKEVHYEAMAQSLQKAGVECEKEVVITFKKSIIGKNENGINLLDEDAMTSYDDMGAVYFLTLDQYKEFYNTDITLNKDEILLASSREKDFDSFNFGDNSYKVVGEVDVDSIRYATDISMSLFENDYAVFSDEEVLEEAYGAVTMAEDYKEAKTVYVGADIKGSLSQDQIDSIRSSLNQSEGTEITFKQEDRVFFYNTYGGVFFVGIFLAILFLMATVMIIYYKQMSEGLQDKERYKILKNIGLTDKEVKSTIKTQVMILFFLPAVTAIIHMLVACNIVRLFLGMMLLIDNATFFMAIAAVSVLFLLTYAIVYKITSKEYYKIVNAQ